MALPGTAPRALPVWTDSSISGVHLARGVGVLLSPSYGQGTAAPRSSEDPHQTPDIKSLRASPC